MARNHMLESLTKVAGGDNEPAVPLRTRPARSPAAVGAITHSIDTMMADLRSAQEKVAKGDVIVELDVNLIDASFVADRLNIAENPETVDFVQSIREHGQRTPILVRPHPTAEGRYQVAYGHRRLYALKIIGRPIKAQIMALSDEELVIAQGQENQSRLDLSFVERCLFAKRLDDRKVKRETIYAALRIDQPQLSRMLQVARGVPMELIEKIGPAPSVGRRRWLDLVESLKPLNWEEASRNIVAAAEQPGTESDDRFNLVMSAVAQARPAVHPSMENVPRLDHPTRDAPPATGAINPRAEETTSPTKGAAQNSDPRKNVKPESTPPPNKNANRELHPREGILEIENSGGEIRIRILHQHLSLSEDEIEKCIGEIKAVCAAFGLG